MRILDVDEAAPAAARELSGHLVADEQVLAGFVSPTGFILFTDRRLIFIDKQGVTGRKISYHSVPYRSIPHFSVETAGSFENHIVWD